MDAPGSVREYTTNITTITQSMGSKILLTFPIPSFKSALIMAHTASQMITMDTKTFGTIVNIPDIESDACKTFCEKYKSGFGPHALVKLKTRYIKSHPTTHM